MRDFKQSFTTLTRGRSLATKGGRGLGQEDRRLGQRKEDRRLGQGKEDRRLGKTQENRCS